VGVQGLGNGGESSHGGPSPNAMVIVHAKVKGSWKCRWGSMRKFRVPRMGARVHMGIKGSWNCRRDYAQEFKVLEMVAKFAQGQSDNLDYKLML